MENVMLKDELRNCRESKGSLKEQLSKMKNNNFKQTKATAGVECDILPI